jgi:hypothetical protein
VKHSTEAVVWALVLGILGVLAGDAGIVMHSGVAVVIALCLLLVSLGLAFAGLVSIGVRWSAEDRDE